MWILGLKGLNIRRTLSGLQRKCKDSPYNSRGIDAVFNTSVGGDYYYKGALS